MDRLRTSGLGGTTTGKKNSSPQRYTFTRLTCAYSKARQSQKLTLLERFGGLGIDPHPILERSPQGLTTTLTGPIPCAQMISVLVMLLALPTTAQQAGVRRS